jgi:hypothetical protein
MYKKCAMLLCVKYWVCRTNLIFPSYDGIAVKKNNQNKNNLVLAFIFKDDLTRD